MYYNKTTPYDWCGVCKHHKLTQQSSTLNGYFKGAASQLKLRDPAATVTDVELLKLWKKQRGRCIITGIPMTYQHTDYTNAARHYTNASVDRINSSIGYIPSNIQLICQRVNYMKSNVPEGLLYWTALRIIKGCEMRGIKIHPPDDYTILDTSPPHPSVSTRVTGANPLIVEQQMLERYLDEYNNEK
jgi:hypothetical protein